MANTIADPHLASLPGSSRALVRTSTIWMYGALGLPLATLGYPIAIFLPDLYASGVGMSLPQVGYMLLLARLGDAVTDPLIGFWSDGSQSRFGRRKPWIVAGVPVMLLGMWLLFHPSPQASPGYLLLCSSFMTIGTTLILIPYGAWGAELATEYHARTRIQHSREIFVLLGLMTAAAVPFLVQDVFELGFDSQRVLSSLGLVLLVLMPVFTGLLIWRVPEAEQPTPHARARTGKLRALRRMVRNGLFRRVLAIELIVTLGEAFRNALSLFFIRDYIGIPNVGRFYVVYFGVGLIAMPLWTRIAGRFGKHRSLAGAMALVSVVSLCLFALDRGQETAFYVLFALKGFCFGAFAYLPRAMLADVIDIDTARSREERAGSYFSVHGMMTKGAQALGPGLALPLLGAVGYSVADRAANGTAELLWLGTLYAIVPTLLFLAALYVAWTYPLTRERHARLEARLHRRRSQGQAP